MLVFVPFFASLLLCVAGLTRLPGAQAATLAASGIAIGFIPTPDGTKSPLTPLNNLLTSNGHNKAATFGWYAQTYKGVLWNGSQLLDVKDEVVKSGAIFEPAVMPVKSYWGYTATNTKQAVAVAKVLKQFTDAGVEVRLRFAHEANYYSSEWAVNDTIQYKGGDDAADNFKVAFQQVYKACQKYAPKVKMVWSPSNSTVANLEKWAPANGTYDFVALDYYPTTDYQRSAAGYLATIKPFHDRWTNSRVKFIIAETGVKDDIKTKSRVEWLQTLTSATVRKALPNMKSVTWFNLDKEYDYRVLSAKGKLFNNAFMDFLGSSTSTAKAQAAVASAASSTSSTSASTASCKRSSANEQARRHIRRRQRHHPQDAN